MKPVFVGGPSGVGKSHLTKYLVDNENFKKIITLTTRPPRNNEIPYINYEFVTIEEFHLLETNNDLAVSDSVLNHMYGLRKGTVESILEMGLIPICEVYSPHIRLFTDIYPDALTVFMMTSDFELLENRLKSRGDKPDDIKRRLAAARDELELFFNQTHCHFKLVHDVSHETTTTLVTRIKQACSLNEG